MTVLPSYVIPAQAGTQGLQRTIEKSQRTNRIACKAAAFPTVRWYSHGKAQLCLHLGQRPYGSLYVGVTVDLIQRVSQHKTGIVSGFTKEYGVKRLVWYETHADIMQAITREKRIKRWRRDWKVNLIQQMNADWRDLFDDIAGQVVLGSPPARG